MTSAEFKTWLKLLESQMPGLSSGIHKHPAMLVAWERELEDVSLQDASEAVSRMRRGEAERPAPSERDYFPAFVLTAVQAIRFERVQTQQAEEDAQKHFRSGASDFVKVGMKQAYVAACEEYRRAKAAGENPEAAVHSLVTELFDDGRVDMRDAFKCRTCRDRGTVECWDIQAMQDARRSVMGNVDAHPERWRTVHVSCSCSAGKATWAQRQGQAVKKREMPRYDDKRWVRADAGVDALLEWAANYRPPNYVDFGEYSHA